MRRGIFFAFLCAIVVALTGMIIVAASFLRPVTVRNLLLGSKRSFADDLEKSTFSTAEIVEFANPGVVTVVAMRTLREDERTSGTAEGNNVHRGTGTGFIIDDEGYIVTNEHVIKDAERIRVKLADGRDFNAVVKGVDRATDLALLKIDAGDLTILLMGNSDEIRVGDPVVAIGNPVEYERTVTTGIVSAKGRKVYNKDPFEDFLQTDAAINRGNSGGPLLNQFGEVIGVNTVIRVDASGISFAVPSNVVSRVISQLRANGQVSWGYLGLTPINISPEFREGLNLKGIQGVLVGDVRAEWAAARAGIQPYDIVTHFDGKPIRNTDDFFSLVANTAPQKQVELQVYRGGQQVKLQATLDQRPPREDLSSAQTTPVAEKTQEPYNLSLGFSVRENTPQVMQELRLGSADQKISGGVIVSEVDPLGPAADARLAVGHIIVEANRQPIHSIEDFYRILSALKSGDVLIIRFMPPTPAGMPTYFSLAAIRTSRR
jgi:serine protease Do